MSSAACRTMSRRRCSTPILNIGDANEWHAIGEKSSCHFEASVL